MQLQSFQEEKVSLLKELQEKDEIIENLQKLNRTLDLQNCIEKLGMEKIDIV
jgi:hypothetical protein